MRLTIAGVFVLCLCLQVQGYVGQTFRFGCSRYTFHVKSKRSESISWEESETLCENNGSKLVSMENVSAELNFLTNNTTQALKKFEYYIGLRKVNKKWKWISNNSTMDASEGKYPWMGNQPSGTGNCAKIYFDKKVKRFGYDDILCGPKRIGYICESPLECDNQNEDNRETTQKSIKESRTRPITSQTSPSMTLSTQQKSATDVSTIEFSSRQAERTTRLSTTQMLQATSAAMQSTFPTQQHPSSKENKRETTQRSIKKSRTRVITSQASPSTTLSTQQKSDTDVSTIEIFSRQAATLPEDTFNESPDVKASKDGSFLIGIILGLLAVIILAILIIFFVLFARRRRTNKAKASLLRQQSSDRDHYPHSSTELTVHFSMSRQEEGQSTFRTVSESKEEYTYAVVDKSKRKSRCNKSSVEQGEEQQTPPDDGHFTDHPVSGDSEERIEKTTDKEDRKDHVYAVVHIQQGKAAVCRDPALQEENVDATYAPNSSTHEGGGHAELFNSLSLERGKEMTQNSGAADGQNVCGEYLYAAVDKASKKQRPPQMPSPYRGLVYADMSHLPENKTGNVNRANAPTVYAAISHQKTGGTKSSLPKESADQETTYKNDQYNRKLN